MQCYRLRESAEVDIRQLRSSAFGKLKFSAVRLLSQQHKFFVQVKDLFLQS